MGGTAGGTAFLLTSSGGTAKDIKGADLGGSSCKKIIKMISAKAYLVLLLSSMMVNAEDFLYCYNFKVVGNGQSEIKIPGHSHTKNNRAEADITLKWDGIYTVGDKYSVKCIEKPQYYTEKAVAVGRNGLHLTTWIGLGAGRWWWSQRHSFHCRELVLADIRAIDPSSKFPPDVIFDLYLNLGISRQNARFYAHTDWSQGEFRKLAIKDGDLCKVQGTHICHGHCQVNTNKCFPTSKEFTLGESCKGLGSGGETVSLKCAKDLVCKDYKCEVAEKQCTHIPGASFCNSGYFCSYSNNICEQKKKEGDRCIYNSECKSGLCDRLSLSYGTCAA